MSIVFLACSLRKKIIKFKEFFVKKLCVFVLVFLTGGFSLEVHGSEFKNNEEINNEIIKDSNARTKIFKKVPTKLLFCLARFFMERLGQFIFLIGETCQTRAVSLYENFLSVQNAKINQYKEIIESNDEKHMLFILIDEFDKRCARIAPFFSPAFFQQFLSLRVDAAQKIEKILHGLNMSSYCKGRSQWSAQTLFSWRLKLNSMRHLNNFLAKDTKAKLMCQTLCQMFNECPQESAYINEELVNKENCASILSAIDERIKYKKEFMSGNKDYRDFIEIQKQVESMYKSIKNELECFQEKGCGILHEYELLLRDLWKVLKPQIDEALKNKELSAEDKNFYAETAYLIPRYLNMTIGFSKFSDIDDVDGLKKVLDNFDSFAALLTNVCIFENDKTVNSNISPFERIYRNVCKQIDASTLSLQMNNIDWDLITSLASEMEKLFLPFYYVFYTRMLWSSVDSISMLFATKIGVEKGCLTGQIILDEEEVKSLKRGQQFIGEALTLVPLFNFFYKEVKKRYMFLEKKESIVRQDELIKETLKEKKEEKIKEKTQKNKKHTDKKLKKVESKSETKQKEEMVNQSIYTEEQLFYDKAYIDALLKKTKKRWISKRGYTAFRFTWRGNYNATLLIKEAKNPCELNPLVFNTDSRSFYKNDLYHRVMRKLLDEKFFKKGNLVLYDDNAEEAQTIKSIYGLWPKKNDTGENYKGQKAIVFPGFLFVGGCAQKKYSDITKTLKSNMPLNVTDLLFSNMARKREKGACVFIIADKKIIHGCFQHKKL